MSLQSLLNKVLRQDAVYWAPSHETDNFGRPIVVDPVQIKCRWEDVHEVFISQQTGEQLVSQAKVICDREVEVEGMLKLGLLDTLAGSNPHDNREVYQIRKAEKIPDLQGEALLNVAML